MLQLHVFEDDFFLFFCLVALAKSRGCMYLNRNASEFINKNSCRNNCFDSFKESLFPSSMQLWNFYWFPGWKFCHIKAANFVWRKPFYIWTYTLIFPSLNQVYLEYYISCQIEHTENRVALFIASSPKWEYRQAKLMLQMLITPEIIWLCDSEWKTI